MTTVDLLDQVDERRDETRATLATVATYVRLGLWWTGWLLSRLVLGVVWLLAAVAYGIGWTGARLWPAIRWAGAAVALGWQDARGRPDGAPR